MGEEKWIFTDSRDGTQHEIIINDQNLHTYLTEEQISRIYSIQEALEEIEPKSVIEWVKGFLADVDPEVEIQIYEAIITVYRKLTSKVKLTRPDKGGLYSLLCMISMGGEKMARKVILDNKRLPRFGIIKQMWQEAIKDIPPKDYGAYSRKYGSGGKHVRFNVDDLLFRSLRKKQ
jgi:hypothetical protein